MASGPSLSTTSPRQNPRRQCSAFQTSPRGGVLASVTLSLSSRHNKRPQAISWFKETALEHIEQMHEFQKVLERYWHVVERITAERIGYILYEDEFQAAAHPFKDTPT
jgi:hypothetical protein